MITDIPNRDSAAPQETKTPCLKIQWLQKQAFKRLLTPFKNTQFCGTNHTHIVVQPSPLFISRIFSSFQTETQSPARSPKAGRPCGLLPGIRAARDSGSDPPPAGAALPLSPALSTRAFLPCPLRPESGGVSRLSANLSRVPLLFWTQDLPLPRAFLARKISLGLDIAPSPLEPSLSHAILTSNGRGNNRHPNSSPSP